MTAPRHTLFLLAAAALLAGGCTTTGTETGANRNPAAWRPPVADLAARTGSVGARPLRPDDVVEIFLHIPAGDKSSKISDVVDTFGVITLPLVGQVAAGVPILAEENIEDMITLPVEIVGDSASFLLSVHGESLIEAGITRPRCLMLWPHPSRSAGCKV